MGIFKNKKAVSIKGLTAAFVITLLFFIGMINILLNMQIQNDANSASSDPFLNQTFNDVKSSLTQQQTIADTQAKAFNDENPKQDATDITSNTISTSTKTITGSTITGSFKILVAMFTSKLGIDPIVFISIGTILITAILLLVWSAWRQGEK